MRNEQSAAAGLVLVGVASVQIGSAVATTLFDELGPAGTVFLRTLFAAAVLLAIWRPAAASLRGVALRDVALFGLVLAGMNLSFYLALDRLPLGIAVTFEFTGPLAVAIAASRRALDVAWVGLAVAGILLLAPGIGDGLDAVGVMFALLAGAFWGAYVLLSARVGRGPTGTGGLAVAMGIAAVLMIVPGVAGGGEALLEPELLAVGLAVAMLSSAIPYTLELQALRRLREGTFGILLSLEPAVAALVGLVFLDQGLLTREVVAICLVVIASAGALSTAPAVEEPQA
jgi:inner membrane transporter RhtA